MKAKTLKAIHGWLTIQWFIHIPVVAILYIFFNKIWTQISILYLALVSIYANAATHFGAWQGSRAELQAKKISSNEINTKRLEVKK